KQSSRAMAQAIAEPVARSDKPRLKTLSSRRRQFSVVSKKKPTTDNRSLITDNFLLILGRPGGHGEGQDTRSHPELGRENPQRRWYCVSRRGRVGRRQASQGPEDGRQSFDKLRMRDGRQRRPSALLRHHILPLICPL